MKYKIYYSDGRTIKVEKISEVVEQIVFYNAIGYEKVK